MVDETQLRARYEKAGQEHVLKYLSKISPSEKVSLLQQLDSIKVEAISSLLGSALADQKNLGESEEITPFSKRVGPSADKEEAAVAYKSGIEAINRGEVAALVLAGGQGTRLGFAGPKGMYEIGLQSKSTLFQLLCERLMKLRKIAASSDNEFSALPFYIMTSPINHEETVGFFEKNSYFGLPKTDVCFFKQGMLPCVTNDGKMIMETMSKVAMGTWILVC